MRGTLLIAGFLIAAIGAGCSGTLSRNKAVARGPVFEDLRISSAPDESEEEVVMRPGDAIPIKPGDVIAINFKQPGGRELQFVGKIRDDGTVTLLSNKVFIAAGRTARQFEMEVYASYGPKLYSIAVTDPAPIIVFGEIKSPGKRPFTGPTTVLKAIESAGGFTDRANQRTVKLIRADGQQLLVNCVKVRKEAQLDVPVFPNDRIFVPGQLW
jgi:protein involved in polysaccharide export with SLBB domain